MGLLNCLDCHKPLHPVHDSWNGIPKVRCIDCAATAIHCIRHCRRDEHGHLISVKEQYFRGCDATALMPAFYGYEVQRDDDQ